MEEKSQDFVEVTDWFSDTSETQLKWPVGIIPPTQAPREMQSCISGARILYLWGGGGEVVIFVAL